MISVVRGEVLLISSTAATIDVHGVGLRVVATPATLSALTVGREAFLHTVLVVREDSLTLYGFADQDERATFEILQGVSGVGPRLALAILAVHTPNLLRQAVHNQDTAALQRVSGIGKKGAQRLILELGTKLGPANGLDPVRTGVPAGGVDVVEALVGLGWTERDAQLACEEAQALKPEGDVATLLRTSLQILGNRR